MIVLHVILDINATDAVDVQKDFDAAVAAVVVCTGFFGGICLHYWTQDTALSRRTHTRTHMRAKSERDTHTPLVFDGCCSMVAFVAISFATGCCRCSLCVTCGSLPESCDCWANVVFPLEYFLGITHTRMRVHVCVCVVFLCVNKILFKCTHAYLLHTFTLLRFSQQFKLIAVYDRVAVFLPTYMCVSVCVCFGTFHWIFANACVCVHCCIHFMK